MRKQHLWCARRVRAVPPGMQPPPHTAGPRPAPPLVLVNGAPAAGKSTLARHLAAALRLPLLSRDALKEAMADRVPFQNLAEAERFGLASVGVFYHTARALLDAGIGVVLDNVFARGVVEDDLRPLLTTSR